LIETAFGQTLIARRLEALSILDIGSGAGTTVFPMLELFPNSHLVATDLSLPLLARLLSTYKKDYSGATTGRFTVLQMNAEAMILGDSQADVVLGADVLHHMVYPERALQEIRRVLKPDGLAVFWEGFEYGAQIMAGIFDVLLEMTSSRATSDALSVEIIALMRNYMADLIRRRGQNKPIEVLLELDDKWYFTRSPIDEKARSAGFTRCRIENVYEPHNLVWSMVDHELRRGGQALAELPMWAQEKVRETEHRFSDEYLRESPFSAAIILQ
jgi:ubiquinone/menaquinone biosynthesis C-methylase UbiE